MRIVIDEQMTDLEAANVGEAIAAAADRAEQADRLIVDVMVDGAAWTSDELEQPEKQSLDADEVRLTSIERTELLRQTFADADEALAETGTLHESAADDIEAGRTAEAMGTLSDAMTIWQQVQQAAEQGAGLGEISLGEVRVGETSAEAIIGELNDHLRGIRDALESRDLVAVSDTLRYDLPDVVDRWRELFIALARTV